MSVAVTADGGANLPDNDAWTLALLTNPEVLAVNQDALGSAARQMAATNGIEIWVKPLQDGSHAVGIFNRGQFADFDESNAIYKSPLITRDTQETQWILTSILPMRRKLWLVVDDGGDGNGYDHADWISPRLSGPTAKRI